MASKPGPKREKIERERDLIDVAQLYLEGWTQQAIADYVSEKYYPGTDPLTQQQIGYDIKVLIKRWQKSQALNIDEAKSRELARIDKLEREYWQAWERSCEDAETVRQEGKPKTKDDKPDKVVHTRKGQVGDPRFLQGVQWCIMQRCKILGIEAPTKQEISGAGGGPIKTEDATFTDEDRINRIATIFDQARAKRNQQTGK